MECKRKAGLLDVERDEAALAREVFLELRSERLLAGRRVELELAVEDPKRLSTSEIVDAVREAATSAPPASKRAWGSVLIVALPTSVQLPEADRSSGHVVER